MNRYNVLIARYTRLGDSSIGLRYGFIPYEWTGLYILDLKSHTYESKGWIT